MKRIAAILTLLLSVTFASGFQGSSDWIKYESTAGRYGVQLPSQPTLSTQEAAAETGEKFTQYMAMSSERNTVYLIGYFDHQPPISFSLERARDGMIQAIHGTLIRDTVITLGGYPGREVRAAAKGDDGVEYSVLARFYDVEKRVYILQFIIPKTEEGSASAAKAAKYLDSFRVIDAGKASKGI